MRRSNQKGETTVALIDMWREDRDGIRNKSLHQIIALALPAKAFRGEL